MKEIFRNLLFYTYHITNFLIITIMPRENTAARAIRLTRSGRRDPTWETIILLQERVKILERQLRRCEKNRTSLLTEVLELRTDLNLLQDGREIQLENKELRLRNQNLKTRIDHLEQLLTQAGGSVPIALDRSFSHFDFF